jgi:hypothetical protein
VPLGRTPTGRHEAAPRDKLREVRIPLDAAFLGSSDLRTDLLGVLVALTFVSAVPLILINTFLWYRFERLYRRSSPHKMPPIIFDFRGRWLRARGEPHPDAEVDRARRLLNRSYAAFLIPVVLMIAIEILALTKR